VDQGTALLDGVGKVVLGPARFRCPGSAPYGSIVKAAGEAIVARRVAMSLPDRQARYPLPTVDIALIPCMPVSGPAGLSGTVYGTRVERLYRSRQSLLRAHEHTTSYQDRPSRDVGPPLYSTNSQISLVPPPEKYTRHLSNDAAASGVAQNSASSLSY